ncbi:MAG: hypothetical protein RR546_05015 [Erysipelotrichaceae bacterium]
MCLFLLFSYVQKKDVTHKRSDEEIEEKISTSMHDYFDERTSEEEKEVDRLYAIYLNKRNEDNMHGLSLAFYMDSFTVYEGEDQIDKSKHVYQSELVKNVYYMGDEFLLFEYEGVIKEFSKIERKLTGVEFQDVGDLFLDTTKGKVFGFYSDDEVVIYNEEGSKNKPFPCTKEQLHANSIISLEGRDNFEIVGNK